MQVSVIAGMDPENATASGQTWIRVAENIIFSGVLACFGGHRSLLLLLREEAENQSGVLAGWDTDECHNCYIVIAVPVGCHESKQIDSVQAMHMCPTRGITSHVFRMTTRVSINSKLTLIFKGGLNLWCRLGRVSEKGPLSESKLFTSQLGLVTMIFLECVKRYLKDGIYGALAL